MQKSDSPALYVESTESTGAFLSDDPEYRSTDLCCDSAFRQVTFRFSTVPEDLEPTDPEFEDHFQRLCTIKGQIVDFGMIESKGYSVSEEIAQSSEPGDMLSKLDPEYFDLLRDTPGEGKNSRIFLLEKWHCEFKLSPDQIRNVLLKLSEAILSCCHVSVDVIAMEYFIPALLVPPESREEVFGFSPYFACTKLLYLVMREEWITAIERVYIENYSDEIDKDRYFAEELAAGLENSDWANEAIADEEDEYDEEEDDGETEEDSDSFDPDDLHGLFGKIGGPGQDHVIMGKISGDALKSLLNLFGNIFDSGSPSNDNSGNPESPYDFDDGDLPF